ncbi:lipoate--protein ligase family protein [Halobacteria archaeon AArc-curdl1]|uniref:Lipoate--protein ligase family protein n=1 Tax=Natronosalvus hydrolyticus TaxID=2979988 RepID=A0AAP2ZC28_9EURY|nr:lipoate--protein ligase family protein [Halobacteria archaeon AArc-curdl1]
MTSSVRVLRGRASTINGDREASGRLLEFAAKGQRAVRVWAPHRQVAFGRRDSRLEGYDAARAAAEGQGFPPVQRRVGGRAVVYDGTTTLAFARAEPVADFRRGTDDRYERLTTDIETALENLDLEVSRGEPADSFCPGAHSLSLTVGESDTLRKVVGIAQRVQREAAVVSGIVIVDAADELADVLEAVYGALEVPFDPRSVGSLALVDEDIGFEAVRDGLESALVGEKRTVLEPVEP